MFCWFQFILLLVIFAYYIPINLVTILVDPSYQLITFKNFHILIVLIVITDLNVFIQGSSRSASEEGDPLNDQEFSLDLQSTDNNLPELKVEDLKALHSLYIKDLFKDSRIKKLKQLL